MTCWTDLLGTPFSVSWVDAGGVPTRALVAGEGDDVVFLHGTSGHLEAFTRNIGPYVAAGFRCHAIDLLGHGYTEKPQGDYEIPRYVDHLLAYLDAQEVRRASLVGESIGGWIAAWVASDHPDRVDHLVLVAPGGTKANPAVMERIRTSTEAAVHSDDPALTRKRMELLMFDPADATDELVEIRYRIYREPEFQRHLPQLLCLQQMDIRQTNLLTSDRMARIENPTLIVWGHENPFGDVPEAKAMHEAIPASHLVLFERCGHWPQHEHPDRFNTLSIGFIRSGEVVDPGAQVAAAAGRAAAPAAHASDDGPRAVAGAVVGAVRRGYVDVPWGQLHYARSGRPEWPSVVLVHQTPRSWDEFRDVLALLGSRFDTVAPDTAGFGASDPADGETDSIERYADGLQLLLDGLGLGPVALVGHHTGGLVALEVAARASDRVWALVLSSASYTAPAEGAAALAGTGIDEVVERPDGGHLTELWRRRMDFYPDGRTDLLHRLVTDALRVGARVEEGHRAVSRYDVQARATQVTVPTLVLSATDDPFTYPTRERLAAAIPHARMAEIKGGMVPLPDQLPEEFAAQVGEFLAEAASDRSDLGVGGGAGAPAPPTSSAAP